MANADRTEIAVILDRSGSMQHICDDMVGGFKTFVDGHRAEPGQCVLSLYQFDSEFDVVYEAKPLSKVGALKLEPRGETALLDAVGKSITLIAERHDKLPEGERPTAVIVLVITDGHENASTEWNLAGVHTAVTAAQEKRRWNFVFLGADAAAFEDARSMGIATAMEYERTPESIGTLYSMVLERSRSYRR